MTACGPLRAPLTESPLPRPGLVLPRPAPGMDYRIDAGGHILSDWAEEDSHDDFAILQLQSGGKGKSKRQNLFTISATATEYLVPWVPDQLRPIPSSDIIVGDLGRLGSDGLLHVVVTDNTTRDATVRTPKKAYSFTVGQQKHALHIVANATPLDEKVAAPLAKDRAGQNVDFYPYLYPVPGGISTKTVRWRFTGHFVNHFEPSNPVFPDQGSVDYSLNDDFLRLERDSGLVA